CFAIFMMDPERWRQIDEILQAALARAAGERASYVRAACAGDEELRREVESLLRADAAAGDFINAPAMEMAAALTSGTARALAGCLLGHYRVVAPLGAGGMGEVWLARDERLGRQVALKLLPEEFRGDADRARRFEQEARAASAVNHPNIATIYEIGVAGNTSFIAMEYVAGQTLAARLEGRPLPVADLVSLAAQAADALDEAHGHGITHRDIKPANLMLTPRGSLKVLDFGLARMRPAPREGTDPLATQFSTRSGMIMGTAPYMSPEQALGRQVDPRSDLFSLGVVMYEMATGRLPFSGASASETIDHIVHATPEAMARFNYELPAELERIIRKCLEKDRERRYQSARELRVDLRNLERDSSPVAAPLVSGDYPRGTGVPRRLALLSLAALGLLAVVALFIWMPGGPGRGNAPLQSLVVLPLANGGAEDDYLSDGMTESLINSLSQLSQLKVIARTTAFRYKGKDNDPQTIGRQLQVDAVLTGRVIRQGEQVIVQADLVNVSDGTQLWGDRFTRKPADLAQVQAEMAQRISAGLRLRLNGADQRSLAGGHGAHPETYELYLKGRYFWAQWSREGLQRAIDYFDQAIARDPDYAPAWSGLADAHNLRGYLGYVTPREAFPKSEEAARRALRLDDTLGEAHLSLAKTRFFYDRDWPGFEREQRRALELNPNFADAWSMQGTYLSAMGRHDEAIAARKRGLELDPLSPFFHVTVGWSYFYKRDYDQAIAWYKKALELDPHYRLAQDDLGTVLLQKGALDEALRVIVATRAQAGESQTNLDALREAAASGGLTGYWRKELELAEAKIRQGAHLPPWRMARIYTGMGDRDRAFAALEQAYAERYSLLVFLREVPIFESLHADPRFADLVRRIGLAG
ncbi:MAG: protein kinase domain-containing protein, partial [Blastocatellia bacterium]